MWVKRKINEMATLIVNQDDLMAGIDTDRLQFIVNKAYQQFCEWFGKPHDDNAAMVLHRTDSRSKLALGFVVDRQAVRCRPFDYVLCLSQNEPAWIAESQLISMVRRRVLYHTPKSYWLHHAAQPASYRAAELECHNVLGITALPAILNYTYGWWFSGEPQKRNAVLGRHYHRWHWISAGKDQPPHIPEITYRYARALTSAADVATLCKLRAYPSVTRWIDNMPEAEQSLLRYAVDPQARSEMMHQVRKPEAMARVAFWSDVFADCLEICHRYRDSIEPCLRHLLSLQSSYALSDFETAEKHARELTSFSTGSNMEGIICAIRLFAYRGKNSDARELLRDLLQTVSQLHAQHVVLLYMLYELTENEKAWQLSKELRASGNPDLKQGAACVDAIWNKR